MVFALDYIISDEDLEPKYEHVHHASVVSILEKGRLALLEAIGQPQEDLLAKGVFLVVTRIDVSYRRELRAGEHTVTCDCFRIDGRIMSLTQQILNGKRKVAVQAAVEFMCLSAELKRGVEPPDYLRKAFVEGV